MNEGHQRGWRPRCHAIDKMMGRLPPGDFPRGIRKLNQKIRASPDNAPPCWPVGCSTATWTTTAGRQRTSAR